VPFGIPYLLWTDITDSNPYLVLLVKVLLPAIFATMLIFGVGDHIALKCKCYDEMNLDFVNQIEPSQDLYDSINEGLDADAEKC
jgi:hypothetical protein